MEATGRSIDEPTLIEACIVVKDDKIEKREREQVQLISQEKKSLTTERGTYGSVKNAVKGKSVTFAEERAH